ncbi:MAG: type III-A CRISPR-associated RAMP protein Csm3 [Candidatus Methanospirare jalkutatii]|nr:type III-A CRISPR-associated RAMP protein Csm3 [Candidatus Methanospirare jalkutatii]
MGGKIKGKAIIRGILRLKTGLHIGASPEVAEIGGLDSPVVKDTLTNEPYIPGSSLKGKMRSLFERAKNGAEGQGDGKFYNREMKVGGTSLWMHACENYEEAKKCEVCRLFGSTGKDGGGNFPSRIIVRDCFLTEDSRRRLEEEGTELKFENFIDRITSAANPRQIERVPAGCEFNFEIIYNIEDENEKEEDLKNICRAMKMLEDDYLGGSGSRGYGKVEMLVQEILERPLEFYLKEGAEKAIFRSENSENGWKRPQEVLEDEAIWSHLRGDE